MMLRSCRLATLPIPYPFIVILFHFHHDVPRSRHFIIQVRLLHLL